MTRRLLKPVPARRFAAPVLVAVLAMTSATASAEPEFSLPREQVRAELIELESEWRSTNAAKRREQWQGLSERATEFKRVLEFAQAMESTIDRDVIPKDPELSAWAEKIFRREIAMLYLLRAECVTS